MTLIKAAPEKNFDEFERIIKFTVLLIISLWIVGVVLVAGGLALLSAIV